MNDPKQNANKPTVVVVMNGAAPNVPAVPKLPVLPHQLGLSPHNKRAANRLRSRSRTGRKGKKGKSKGSKGTKKSKTGKKKSKSSGAKSGAKKGAASPGGPTDCSDSEEDEAPKTPGGAAKPAATTPGGTPKAASAPGTPSTPAPKGKAPPPPVIVPMAIPANISVSTTSSMPQLAVINGPNGVPLLVPLSENDHNGKPIKDGPTPLNRAPLNDTRGCMVVNERGMLYFYPEFMLDQDDDLNFMYPAGATAGVLTGVLNNSSVFIPKTAKFPETASTELGYTNAMSGYIRLTLETGYCTFDQVMPLQLPPHNPTNTTLGVIVKDFVNEVTFFVPCDGKSVGPSLQGAVVPVIDKPKPEGTLLGAIVRGAFEIPKFEACSKKEGKDGVLGWVTASKTGVPIYAPERGPNGDFPNPPGSTPAQIAAAAAAAKAKAALRTPKKKEVQATPEALGPDGKPLPLAAATAAAAAEVAAEVAAEEAAAAQPDPTPEVETAGGGGGAAAADDGNGLEEEDCDKNTPACKPSFVRDATSSYFTFY